MPASSRPGIGRSRAWVAPPASTTASRSARSSSAVTSTPTLDVAAELGALGLHLLEAAVEVALLHLELGDAVAQQAADAVGPLEDDDRVAGAGRAAAAAARPAGPGADDGDRLAACVATGISGVTQPSAQRAVDDLAPRSA